MNSLHNRILAGLLLGIVAGVSTNWVGSQVPSVRSAAEYLTVYVMEPVGQVFLRMLLMVVIPLVFASLTLGVVKLGGLRRLGQIGLKTLLYFVITSAVAVVIGLILVNTVRPGVGIPEDTRTRLLATYGGEASDRLATAQQPALGLRVLVNVIPRNPIEAAARGDMLPVIFFSLIFGVALTRVASRYSEVWTNLLQGLGDATIAIINMAMTIAPYGVFALIFAVTSRFGYDILRQLSIYLIVVLAGLALHMLLVYSVILRVFVGLKPQTFFRKIRAVMITAFSTSSSGATLPTTMRVSEEELGVPPQIAGFVLPLGATLNMDGTALFEGVTAIFLAQVFGVELSLVEQLTGGCPSSC